MEVTKNTLRAQVHPQACMPTLVMKKRFIREKEINIKCIYVNVYFRNVEFPLKCIFIQLQSSGMFILHDGDVIWSVFVGVFSLSELNFG